MLRVSELKKVLELKQNLGIPLSEGSCFGVHDQKELRPPFKLPQTAVTAKKEDKKK